MPLGNLLGLLFTCSTLSLFMGGLLSFDIAQDMRSASNDWQIVIFDRMAIKGSWTSSGGLNAADDRLGITSSGTQASHAGTGR